MQGFLASLKIDNVQRLHFPNLPPYLFTFCTHTAHPSDVCLLKNVREM